MTIAYSILFVCTGNICRSPTAEGILRHRLKALGRLNDIRIDSAATHSWNIGNPPDPRSAAVAKGNGVSLNGITARKIAPSDFTEYDLILAMDKTHLASLRAYAPSIPHAEIRLFLAGCPGLENIEVPDPYYGEIEGFHSVYNMIDRGVNALLKSIDLD